jgi:hypothetical protein
VSDEVSKGVIRLESRKAFRPARQGSDKLPAEGLILARDQILDNPPPDVPIIDECGDQDLGTHFLDAGVQVSLQFFAMR